jgi:hypothetical protein
MWLLGGVAFGVLAIGRYFFCSFLLLKFAKIWPDMLMTIYFRVPLHLSHVQFFKKKSHNFKNMHNIVTVLSSSTNTISSVNQKESLIAHQWILQMCSPSIYRVLMI